MRVKVLTLCLNWRIAAFQVWSGHHHYAKLKINFVWKNIPDGAT